MEKSKINNHKQPIVIISASFVFIISLIVSYFYVKNYSKIYKDKQYADITTCYGTLEMQVYSNVMKSFSKILPAAEIIKNNGASVFEHGGPFRALMTYTDIIGFMYAPDTVIQNVFPKEQLSNYVGLDLSKNFPEFIDKKYIETSENPIILGPFTDLKTSKKSIAVISAIYKTTSIGKVYDGSVVILVDCESMLKNVDLSSINEKNILCKVWQKNEYNGHEGIILESKEGFTNTDSEKEINFKKLYFTTTFNFSFIPKYSFYHTLSFRVAIVIDFIFCVILAIATFFIVRGFFYTEELKLYKVQSKLVTVQEHIIISLSSLVENRDSDTGSHVQRTSDYVYMIAKQAKASKVYTEILTDEYIEMLKNAAPMHDIGKIVVPDAILKKPGKLDPEEFDQIKQHTVEGAKIVQDIIGPVQSSDFVQITQQIAESHHEKWNGTGYPYGLKETDIPLSARIMALADVFDALTTPRCYKAPFPFEKAVSIIAEGAGTQFDPKLTEVFLANQDKLREILSRYFKID